MKYRRNKVKREHGIIQDALNWLEDLGQNPDVTDIIPGVIEVSRSPERCIVYKYPTQTGCKLLLKSNGSIQEAFVVTKNPDQVKEWVELRFPSTPEKADHASPVTPSQKGPRITDSQSKEKLKAKKPYNFKATQSTKKRRKNCTEPIHFGNQDLPNLGQQINSNTRQALRALQKELGGKHKKT